MAANRLRRLFGRNQASNADSSSGEDLVALQIISMLPPASQRHEKKARRVLKKCGASITAMRSIGCDTGAQERLWRWIVKAEQAGREEVPNEQHISNPAEDETSLPDNSVSTITKCNSNINIPDLDLDVRDLEEDVTVGDCIQTGTIQIPEDQLGCLTVPETLRDIQQENSVTRSISSIGDAELDDLAKRRSLESPYDVDREPFTRDEHRTSTFQENCQEVDSVRSLLILSSGDSYFQSQDTSTESTPPKKGFNWLRQIWKRIKTCSAKVEPYAPKSATVLQVITLVAVGKTKETAKKLNRALRQCGATTTAIRPVVCADEAERRVWSWLIQHEQEGTGRSTHEQPHVNPVPGNACWGEEPLEENIDWDALSLDRLDEERLLSDYDPTRVQSSEESNQDKTSQAPLMREEVLVLEDLEEA